MRAYEAAREELEKGPVKQGLSPADQAALRLASDTLVVTIQGIAQGMQNTG